MSRRSQRLVMAGLLLAGFVLQAAFASDVRMGAAQPEPALCVLVLECLYVGPRTGAWLGFGLGLLEAAYAARVVGSFIVTRTLAGFAVGALEDRVFRDSLPFSVIAVAVTTLLVEAAFFVFVPPRDALAWLGRVGGATAYNSALALPLYFIVRRCVRRAAT